MPTQPTPAPLQDHRGQPAADPHGHRAVLHALVGMGADMARLLHQQATLQAGAAQSALPPQPAPAAPYNPPAATLINLASAFDRISRAVRRCIALAERLAHPPAPRRDPAHTRAAARKQILRTVGDSIHRAANEGDRAASLTAELYDRLDAPDLDWDLATRPVPDIIAEITRDLGLAIPPGGARPWPRRTPADIQDLDARAAAPSRPSQNGQGRAAPAYRHQASPTGHQAPPAAHCPNGQDPDHPNTDPQETGPQPPQTGAQPGTSPRANHPTTLNVRITPPTPDTWPALRHPRTPPPDDPARDVTTIPQRPTRLRGHWRPPPDA